MAAINITSAITALMYRLQGAAKSDDIQRELGISQPTASRALAAMIRDGSILRVGAARQSLYLLPATDAGVLTPVSIMRVDAAGEAHPFGRLTPLVGGRYCVEFTDGKIQIYGGLPWFLSDMRPQGFLGRLFSRTHASLNLDSNPLKWHDKDIVRALVSEGDDLPGNLLLGEAAFQRFLLARRIENQTVNVGDYADIAKRVMAGAAVGSPAGGEQPKFCALRHDGENSSENNSTAVIVKFSPLDDSLAATRWRDLLICEHLALTTLRDNGIRAAASRLIMGDRVYLEIERFDRTQLGRIGMVSLEAFDAEYIGGMASWDKTAISALSRGLINAADARDLLRLEAFGRLIANTDRHNGNVSLIRLDNRWQLAPAYDMLPMFYAPVSNEVIAQQYDVTALQPTLDTLSVWQECRQLAEDYWQRVRRDERISVEFQTRLALDWDAWLTA
jgi:hypothetical protein